MPVQFAQNPSFSYTADPTGNNRRRNPQRVTPMGQGEPLESYFKSSKAPKENAAVAALTAQLSALQFQRGRKSRKNRSRKNRKSRRRSN
jgi:hypothetical protein